MTESTGRASLARSGGLVAPALTLVNVFAYVVTVVGARQLSKDDYGYLVALLGVLLVGCVPALGLQAVVARATVQGTATTGALLRRSLLFGLGATAVTAALSPVVAAFLHSSVTGPLLVAANLAPVALLSGAMGVLQGQERFGRLALVIVGQAVARGSGLVPLVLGGTAEQVLLVMGLAFVVSALVGVAFVGVEGGGPAFGVVDVAHATSGLLALLLLANLDVLLARNVLTGAESGRYAVGAVLSKMAFWLPQAVAVVVFPRLSDPEEGKALLRKALVFVGALGAVEVIGCALLAEPVLEITFGEQYGSLSDVAWLWVVQGAALSLVQLLVYRAIAVRDRVTGAVIGAVAAIEAAIVLVWRPDSPSEVVVVAAVLAVATTATLLLRKTR